MNTSRRTLLKGLGALPMVPMYGAVAVASPADPILPIYAESVRLADFINGEHHETEAAIDALMDRSCACNTAAMTVKATTPAGAIASIEWAQSELLEFGFTARPFIDERDAGLAADRGAKLVLALLDGALGVLRAQGGVA